MPQFNFDDVEQLATKPSVLLFRDILSATGPITARKAFDHALLKEAVPNLDPKEGQQGIKLLVNKLAEERPELGLKTGVLKCVEQVAPTFLVVASGSVTPTPLPPPPPPSPPPPASSGMVPPPRPGRRPPIANPIVSPSVIAQTQPGAARSLHLTSPAALAALQTPPTRNEELWMVYRAEHVNWFERVAEEQARAAAYKNFGRTKVTSTLAVASIFLELWERILDENNERCFHRSWKPTLALSADVTPHAIVSGYKLKRPRPDAENRAESLASMFRRADESDKIAVYVARAQMGSGDHDELVAELVNYCKAKGIQEYLIVC